jgi:hypothetical protein
MDLAEVLGDEKLRLREFPVCRDKIFLAHAGDAPLPQRVADAVARYVQQATTGDQERFVYRRFWKKAAPFLRGSWDVSRTKWLSSDQPLWR